MIKTDSEFLQFAFSKYDNPHLSSVKEFESDLKRFTLINNLLNRYRADKSDIKDKLIVNHIVILSNCFGVDGFLVMMEYKISPENRPLMDTFLFYLNFIEKTKYPIDFYLYGILDE